MNISVEIVPGKWDGDTFIEPKILVKALDGDPADAKVEVQKLMDTLGISGVDFVAETEIENHRDGHGHLHNSVHHHA